MRSTFPGFDEAAARPGEQQLGLERLPPEVARALEAVVIEAPPAFGPPGRP